MSVEDYKKLLDKLENAELLEIAQAREAALGINMQMQRVEFLAAKPR